MKKQIFIFIGLVMLLVMSCKQPRIFTDMYAENIIVNIDKITISFYADTTKTVIISDKHKIEEFMTDLHNAQDAGLWKGAHWDKITLEYNDGDTETFHTNGKVFGQNGSQFFHLNEKYQKYWDR